LIFIFVSGSRTSISSIHYRQFFAILLITEKTLKTKIEKSKKNVRQKENFKKLSQTDCFYCSFDACPKNKNINAEN
jgi:hypothetical protein